MEEFSFEECEMKEELECLIKSHIESSCFDEAVQLISKTLGQIPHFSVLQDIIYKVLMKTKKKSTSKNAFSYLTKVVDIYPPMDNDSRLYYWGALNEKQKKIDFFEVFSNIIRNCLNIPQPDQKTNLDEQGDNVIYNSEFLLQYFFKVLHTDLEKFAAERSEDRDIKSCLLAKVFFKNDKISTQGHFEKLLQYINIINKNPIKYKMNASAALLEDLFCLVLDFFLFHAKRSEAESFNHEQLDEIARFIFRQCNDSFKTYKSLNRFLVSLNVRWARIKICEIVIYKLIYPGEPYSATPPLTLRKIIRKYMFPPISNDKTVEKTYQPPNQKSPEKRNHKGETKMHVACKTDNPDKLSDLIKKGHDVNARDNYDWTPLHEACWLKSKLCVHVLTGMSTVYLNPVNNDGRTPLHCAVMVDSVDIAEDLLTHGDLNALLMKDNEGKTPIDRAKGKEMKQLLRDFEFTRKNMVAKAKNFHNIDTKGCLRRPPVLKNSEAYDIYLLCLHYLFLDYIEIFKLKSVRRRKKYSLKKNVEKHLFKKCKFVYKPTIHDVVAFFDDFFCLERLPSVIKEFSSELIAQTSSESIDVSILLIPFEDL